LCQNLFASCTGDGLGLASLLHAAARWMGGTAGEEGAPGKGTSGLAFSGYLPSEDVLQLLVMQLTLGPDYLVYAAAAVRLQPGGVWTELWLKAFLVHTFIRV